MASSLKSQFGSSTTSALDVAAASKPKHHGFLHNLLEDVVDTAKGIPFGIVQTVEHPKQSFKLMGQSYADTYGHGFGHFWSSFKEHPLQPLLDAISVPLILAGGAGFAVKGASVAAELGRAAQLGSAWERGVVEMSTLRAAGKFAEADAIQQSLARSPVLMKQAQRFRKGTGATTRMVPTPIEGLSLPQAYSSNLFRRALTKGADAILEGVGGKSKALHTFSVEGKGARLLEKELSKRRAATAARSFGQAAVLRHAKKKALEPAEVGNALNADFEHVFMENVNWVDQVHAEALKKNPVFKQEWEFVYAAPDQEVYAWKREPGGGYAATKEMAPGEGYGTKDHTLLGYEGDQIKNFIQTLGERIQTGQSAKKALVNEHGQVAIVRKGAKVAYRDDLAGTAKLAEQIYKKPLKMWKFFVLAGAPRYFINNVVGNAGMYAAATNPLEFTRGVLEAVRRVRGDTAMHNMEGQMATDLEKLMNKYLPNEWVSQNMAYLQHGALGVEQTAAMGSRSPFSRQARSGLYEVTERVSYRGPQRAALMGALTTDSDFRALYRVYKKQGMKDGAAFQKAANMIVRDKRKQAAFEKRVTDWAGQYYHLNKLEKLITALVPFYNWDRHALRFGKEQVLTRPLRTVQLAALGALGDKQADQELGKIPDFMKGAIPVGGHTGGVLGFLLGQRIKGRQKIILTGGYNPLAAAADDVHALAALVGGRSPEMVAGQLNPLVSGAISGVTGQRMFSGAKVDPGLKIGGKQIIGGVVGTALNETFGELPQANLAEASFGKPPETTTKSGNQTLYVKGVRQQLSSLFGLNERDFSPEAAKALYKRQHHIKSPRKRRRKAKAMASALKSQF